MMQKITPFLWFDNQAEEAINFYTSIFKNSRVKDVTRFGEGGPAPAGSLMTASFELEGQEFIALNGGPMFKFTEAISFSISTETQEETDYFWNKLTSGGGQESQCAWLKDKFGLSWQVIPASIGELLTDADPAKAGRVGQALMAMQKLDLATLQRAHRGEPATV